MPGCCSPRMMHPWSTPCSSSAPRLQAYTTPSCTSDTFSTRQHGDALRSKVADQQPDIDRTLRETAAHAGLALIDIPHGLTTAERVRWISSHLQEMDLMAR